MKTIRLTLWTILLGLTGLWVAANLPLPDTLTRHRNPQSACCSIPVCWPSPP